MSDQDFDISVPDVPIPAEAESGGEIADLFSGAVKFSFLGSGQGGSRLAQTMYSLGYRRVAVINTSLQDMSTIELPDSSKLLIGRGGARKDMKLAEDLLDESQEDVFDLMCRSFGKSAERLMVCVCGGGGTGGGTMAGLVRLAARFQDSIKSKTPKVGLLLALPKFSEGAKVAANAYAVLTQALALVDSGVVSPLILLDNERISSIYPGLAVDPFWDTANRSICALLHLFNSIAARQSSYTSFDPSDLESMLDAGILVLGAAVVTRWDDRNEIGRAVRDNLKRNILTGGVDLSTGNMAAAVVIGGKTVFETVPQEALDHAFDQFTRLLKPGSTIHRGIYRGDKDSLTVYTAVGGLAKPLEKLAELTRVGNISHEPVVWPAKSAT